MVDDRTSLARNDQTSEQTVRRTVPTAELGTVLAQIAEQAGTAVRVEIHDGDGSVRTDILNPPDAVVEVARARGADRVDAAIPAGFLPGERVLIACVISTAIADRHGRLALPLGPTPTAVPDNAMWLLAGATSRRVATRPVDHRSSVVGPDTANTRRVNTGR